MPPNDLGRRLMQEFAELKKLKTDLAAGNEQECLELVSLAEQLRKKWLTATNENLAMRTMIQSYEDESKQKKQELRTIKDQLTDARAQIASLLTAKQDVEAERNLLEDQIDTVKELLRDDLAQLSEHKHRRLAFLDQPSRRQAGGAAGGGRRQQHSMGNTIDDDTSPIDYDRTEESMLDEQPKRSHKRSRSVPRQMEHIVEEQPRKRSKEVDRPEDMDTPVMPLRLHPSPLKTPGLSAPTAERKRSMNRSFSETALEAQVQVAAAPAATPKMRLAPGRSMADLRTPPIVSWAAGTPIHQRQHTFHSRSCLKPEYCDVCAKRVMFGKQALKCSDCRATCHMECRVSVPLPCVPRQCTPQNSKGRAARLGDFTPNAPPMIPHVIIHCVNELERRGLDMIGIYRIPGSEGQVNTLLNQFHTQRGVPNLRSINDPATMTGCIKKFLQQLRDPLIPTSSWQEFVNAAQLNARNPSAGYDTLTACVKELPMPHRDTLAYLITHWQRVANNADCNKMPLENLARCLAPTVVGHSSSVKEAGCTPMIMEEMPKQALVMMALMNLPTHFWSQFVDYESKPTPLVLPTRDESPQTPEFYSTTMLGSVYGSSSSATPSAATPHRKAKFFPAPWK